MIFASSPPSSIATSVDGYNRFEGFTAQHVFGVAQELAGLFAHFGEVSFVAPVYDGSVFDCGQLNGGRANINA